MKISVKVKPNAKQEKIEKISENKFQVWVKEPPKDHKANRAVIEVLSNYFSVSKSQIRIIWDFYSKQKYIEVVF
ncbi:MAG: DUF167 domain-containing protein [Candidatus Omnitrophica bacterium]|nr:DUF167 domain-containing protein [Candidatus Omnitrophota bacterium]